MPLLMRYPGEIRAGARIDAIALGIDIAPTILELTGVAAPEDLDGVSLVPLWNGEPENWRKQFLVEYYSDIVFPRIERMGYQAVRTARWKYIRYRELDGMDEFYDLELDPCEMRNLIDASEAREVLTTLKAELDALVPSKTV
jgi:N-acetylglucosamine-6-sulfatase